MRAVDTNLLVRLLVRDDATQVVAAESFIENGAWVSHLVLAETLWVLDAVYERKPNQIAKAIELLLSHTQLTLQDADVVASALDNFRARPSLGFSDCLVLEIARKAGHLPLGTFDKGLAKVDGAHGL
jgi:predicted nucleic-acid-binding protein